MKHNSKLNFTCFSTKKKKTGGKRLKSLSGSIRINLLHQNHVQETAEFVTHLFHDPDLCKAVGFTEVYTRLIACNDPGYNGMQLLLSPFQQDDP